MKAQQSVLIVLISFTAISSGYIVDYGPVVKATKGIIELDSKSVCCNSIQPLT